MDYVSGREGGREGGFEERVLGSCVDQIRFGSPVWNRVDLMQDGCHVARCSGFFVVVAG
jgi:hypothetical protein